MITVCKDRAWCIGECVQSVLRQDYPNIEYLVQDGASRDGTLDVLKQYGDRIHVRSEPDRGPIDAFNKALAIASGDIFCMLLSDERFADDQVVSRAVQALRAHPEAGAIYGDFRVVDVHYREIRVERKRQFRFDEIFGQDEFIAPCAAFVRFDAVREHGVLRPDLRVFFDVIGDYGLWVYVGARHPLTYVPGVVADFMVHSGEVSYGLAHCRSYIRECETAIGAFQSEAYSAGALAALKRRALARLYINYGNALAGKYFVAPLLLAWKGIRRRPRLIFTRAFLAIVVKSAGLSSLIPVRADGKRMKGWGPAAH